MLFSLPSNFSLAPTRALQYQWDILVSCALSLYKDKCISATYFKICVVFKFDKIHTLTYALSSPQRMLIISGYTCLASKAMHRSQRLPYLGEDERKEFTHSRSIYSIYFAQSLRHHLTVSTTFCIIVVSYTLQHRTHENHKP